MDGMGSCSSLILLGPSVLKGHGGGFCFHQAQSFQRVVLAGSSMMLQFFLDPMTGLYKGWLIHNMSIFICKYKYMCVYI